MISASEISAHHKIPLPMVHACATTYQMALAEGFEDQGKGAMIQVFERLLDVKFRRKKRKHNGGTSRRFRRYYRGLLPRPHAFCGVSKIRPEKTTDRRSQFMDRGESRPSAAQGPGQSRKGRDLGGGGVHRGNSTCPPPATVWPRDPGSAISCPSVTSSALP